MPEHQGASVCSTFDPAMKVTTPNRALGPSVFNLSVSGGPSRLGVAGGRAF